MMILERRLGRSVIVVFVMTFIWASVCTAGMISVEKWKSVTGGGGIYTGVTLAGDGTIYFGSSDHHLQAVNPDGTLKWRFAATMPVNSTPAVGTDGTIYVGSDDWFIYAVKPDGTQKWAYETGNWVGSGPAVDSSGTIYCGSGDTYIYALNPDGTLKWRFKTGDMVIASPAIGSSGTIFCGSIDQYLYALNPDGTEKWKYKTSGSIYSKPAFAPDGTIYFGCDDRNVYALNSDGTLKWTYATASTVRSGPAVAADGTIYIGSDDSELRAINPDGTLKWSYVTGGAVMSNPAIGTDGAIFVGSHNYFIHAFNPDGSLRWRHETMHNVKGSPAIAPDGTIYCGSLDGYLYALTQEYAYYVPVFKPGTAHWSGLGITNLSAASQAGVTVKIYSNTGNLLGTQTQTIPANGQASFVVGGSLSSDGWIMITSDQPLAGLNFMGQYNGSSTDSFIADVPFAQEIYKEMVIPHCAQNSKWDTVVYTANPNSVSTEVYFTYYDQHGTNSPNHIVTIPAMGSVEIPVSTIGGSTDIKGGYVIVNSDTRIASFALYHNIKTGNSSFAGINATHSEGGAKAYYLPVFKPKPGFWSGLGITNRSMTHTANIAITVYNRSGSVLLTESKAILPTGQTRFVLGGALTDSGWIKVTSDQPVFGLNFMGQYIGSSTNYYLADVPFADTAAKKLVIPHCAENANWSTTVFIANTTGSALTVNLVYTDKSGTALSPHTITLPAAGSAEVPVSTITGRTDIKGGYVTVTSTGELTAFALYTNLKSGNISYAGINAVIPTN